MGKILAVALGGALGSLGRYCVAVFAERSVAVNFPLGTLAVNLSGCLLIGFFWSYFERVHISNEFRLFLFCRISWRFYNLFRVLQGNLAIFQIGRTRACAGLCHGQ